MTNVAEKSYWNIDSGDGNSLTQGIQSEREARRVAQGFANECGDIVALYEVGNGDGESEVESEEIAPNEQRRCVHGVNSDGSIWTLRIGDRVTSVGLAGDYAGIIRTFDATGVSANVRWDDAGSDDELPVDRLFSE